MKRLLALIAILAPLPASALTITVPIGYSDWFFNLNGQTGMVFQADADLVRDSSICGGCQTGYFDSFTVRFLDADNSVLMSLAYQNYFTYSLYNDSHGIGAGPHWLWDVPAGSVTFEVENSLTLTGTLNPFGRLMILPLGDADGDGDVSLVSAPVPILPALPLFATAVAAMLWRRR